MRKLRIRKRVSFLRGASWQREMVLQRSSWEWRGEGNAHVVLRYKGRDARLRGHVLRLRKTDAPPCVRKELRRLGSVKHVLGERYSIRMRHATMHPKDHQALVSKHRKRENARIREDFNVPSRIKTCTKHVEILEDVIDSGRRPCLCVEIKPKCGVPMKDSRLSSHVFAFALKHGHRSSFQPADIFSHDVERMKKAFHALLESPHNNLKVFLNGSMLSEDEIIDAMKGILRCQRVEAIAWLRDVVVHCLHGDPILLKLLKLQQCDGGGVHEAHKICHNARGKWHRVEDDHARNKLVQYLLARAASDCSIMITIELDVPPCRGKHWGRLQCPRTGTTLRFKLKVVDFELKHLAKITTHLRNHESLVNKHLETLQAKPR